MFYTLRGYKYTCDDCVYSEKHWNHYWARKNGWAISKDYKKCYCPKCAPKHRNVGRNGVKRFTPKKGKNQ